MGRGGQTPMRLVDGRCPSLFFSQPATAHAPRTSSSVARDATVVAALTLPDILFVTVQWCLPPPERRDRWFRRGDE